MTSGLILRLHAVNFSSVRGRLQVFCHQQTRNSRNFSVKALSWCEPTDSPVRRAEPTSIKRDEKSKSAGSNSEKPEFQPIQKFGVVAAMSQNRIIGMDGGIPWRLPEDRKLFKDLTRRKILIIGRKTFEEHPNLVHINHTKACIVVSRSMADFPEDTPIPLHLAQSFSEALDIARKISDEMSSDTEDDLSSSSSNGTDDESKNPLTCWIGGGEHIYEQALKHRSVEEVHLSVVDTEIDYRKSKDVAMFPAKYRWDHKFDIPSSIEFPPSSEESPGFSYFVFKKKKKHS